MKPFEMMDTLIDADGRQTPVPSGRLVFKNDVYQVEVRRVNENLMWLSIKRIDREWMHDWREMQQIKNMLCGPECEGVELYPAESRLVDTANSYHMWVLSPGMRFPFGFDERLVMEGGGTHPLVRNAVQRPWSDEDRPKDLKDPDQVVLDAMGKLP